MRLTNKAEAINLFKKASEVMKQRLADRAFEIGLQGIEEARANANYQNWTNNLRSSYGVLVALDGKVLKSDFKLEGNGKKDDGKDGFDRANKLAKDLADQHPNEIVMVLVCAEYYAGYVESKGFNVLNNFGYKVEENMKTIMASKR